MSWKVDECKPLTVVPMHLTLQYLRDKYGQGLTLVQFSVQPKPFWSHLRVSPCVIDWGKIMNPTYPTKCAYVEPKSGRE